MKKNLFFVLTVLTFAACEQALVEEQSAICPDVPETITVGFEGDDTRIQLNGAQKTVWTKGDQVSVFYFSDANQLWQYNGETGSRTANLKRVNAGEPTAQTTYNVVAYPFNEDYFLNTRTGALHATLPTTQHYLKDSYGVGDNLMVAQSEFTQFSLKNVCGWLKLQLTGDGEVVKSITFKGNDGEQVAGLIHVDTATAEATLASEMGSTEDNNAGGNLVFDDTILTEVTLDCGEGVALGKEATAFYIALPPQTFEQGFTVKIEDTEGYVMEQSTDKTLIIERNHIQPMAAFEFINPATPSAPAPASNEIWYTATAKVEPTFDDSLTFGANVVSNVWDSETQKGIITFDGDVTMIGKDAFINCYNLTTITLPECITVIENNAFYQCDGLVEFTIPESVTTIGSSAFYYCSKLTSITIPDSTTSIGNAAFRNCSSLTEFRGKFAADSGRILVIDGTLVAFAPKGLTEYTIPDSITTIGNYTFSNCSSLTSVTITDSVTSIGSKAFLSCSSLTTVTIPDSVTTIGTQAFGYCKSLTSVTIPNSVNIINDSTFNDCHSLTSVTIPDSVTLIGGDAFNNCSSLKKVYCYAPVPPSLGFDVFKYCPSTRRIYVYDDCVNLYKSEWSSYSSYIYGNGNNCPDTITIEYTTSDSNTITDSKLPIISNSYENGVGTMVIAGKATQIPDNAFSDCKSLTSVTIPDSVTKIGMRAFYGCSSLTSVTIPDSVTTIEYGAFYDCDSLKSVNIPDSVTTIERNAFYSCSSLTEFKGKFAEDNGRVLVQDGTIIAFAPAGLTGYTIPDGITEIGDDAFSQCKNLTSVTIPNSVTAIGRGAFYNSTSLRYVYCKATVPPSLGGTYVFNYNGSGRKIYVPAGSVNAYKSATNWNEYASAIVGYNF